MARFDSSGKTGVEYYYSEILHRRRQPLTRVSLHLPSRCRYLRASGAVSSTNLAQIVLSGTKRACAG